MTPQERLQAAIDALPDTPEGIAAMLAAEGIRGERICATKCPLAVWLTQRCGFIVLIDGHFANGGCLQDDQWFIVPLTDAASFFVRDFDSYDRFPELVAP